MTTIETIITWAENDLPTWQSDAVRRLLSQDAITDDDKNELLLMLKARYGLTDSKITVPTPGLSPPVQSLVLQRQKPPLLSKQSSWHSWALGSALHNTLYEHYSIIPLIRVFVLMFSKPRL